MPPEQPREREPIAQAPQERQSFMDRKRQQLNEERARNGTNEEPLDVETDMSAPLRDEESVQEDGYPELHDGEERLDEETATEEDLDDEAPLEDEEVDEEPEQTVDWEKRYKDTQSELERLRARDRERDDEVAQQMTGAVEMHHAVEDELERAKSFTQFYLDGVDNRIQQLEAAFNSGQIEPERLQEARQYHYQLTQEKTGLEGRMQQLEGERSEAGKKRKKREAEIARVRLMRTIPGWGKEKYAEMRDYALSRGYTAEEFGDITDYRFFEMLHDSMKMSGAAKTVENVTQRSRTKPPRRGKGRVSEQTRDSSGRFQKRRKEFLDNPNQRGRFAAMTEERLKKERRGR